MTRPRLTTRLRLAVFLAAGGRCQRCGLTIAAGTVWHCDHVIPLALGGPHAPANLQLLCRPCHRGKTRRDLADTARAKRRQARHLGARTPRSRPLPCGRNSPWKKTIDGRVVRR